MRRLLHLRCEDTDAIEVRRTVRGAGVRVTGGTGLAGDVGLNGHEGREIGRTLEQIADAADALPGDGNAIRVVGGRRREHGQNGCRIGGVQSSNPILIDVEGCAVGVGSVDTVCDGQSILFEPCIGSHANGRLIFITTYVHGATDDAGIADEIRGRADVGIVAGVDAGRIGLELETTSYEIYKGWRIGDVARA